MEYFDTYCKIVDTWGRGGHESLPHKIVKTFKIFFCYIICHYIIANISHLLLGHTVLIIHIMYCLNVSIIHIVPVQWNDTEPYTEFVLMS